MLLNYKIKEKTKKVELYTQNGGISQTGNDKITQLDGIHTH